MTPGWSQPPSLPLPDDATRDRLVGDWHLFQRRRGHRTSTDDLLTAALAVELAADLPSPVSHYIDLGCGIGSVLFMVAHALRPARTTGVEAQAQSIAMAVETLARLPDAPPITLLHGDLRDADAAATGLATLVTGSPPYLPVGTGVPSPDPQREACRFELRGGVEGYAAAAARLLAPGGRFALVFQTRWDARVLDAAAAAGLALVRRADVAMRIDDPTPFLTVYGFAHGGDVVAPPVIERLAVRDTARAETPAWRAVRARLGLTTA